MSVSSKRAIAALPMYDLPQLRAATDAFWAAIANKLKNRGVTPIPLFLNKTDDYAQTWADPDLLLGQACGYPLLKHLQDKVQIVAAPIYKAAHCEAAEHGSIFIIKAKSRSNGLSDLRHAICAVNGFDSNTGMNLLRAALAPIAQGSAFFQSVIVTGSHYNSLKAVANGSADLASIDAVSFAHFRRFEPELTDCVKEVGHSATAPTPAFITSGKTNAQTLAALHDALFDIATDPEFEKLLSMLLIGGFVDRTAADYEPILRLEQTAANLGYSQLR